MKNVAMMRETALKGMQFYRVNLVMEKSPVISKARALGLARALKLITRAFLGFADPIDFTNVTDLISLYTVQYTILECFLKL